MPAIHDVSKQLFWYCLKHNITLRAAWIPWEQNELADHLSKIIGVDDWMVNPATFRAHSAEFGPFEVDLFASHTNHQVPKYYSQFYTPDTSGVNAFRFKWGRRCWCNPPFRLIGRIWQHALSCGVRMTLVIPYWPSAPWWHKVVDGSATHFAPQVEACKVLPRAPDLFLPGSAGNQIARKTPPWQKKKKTLYHQ